jgi:hypothetical protein
MQPVPERWGRRNHRAAVGQASRIHQRVDAAELFERRIGDDVAGAILGEIRRHEMRARPERLDFRHHGCAASLVTPADEDCFRPVARRFKRDGTPHALRGAGDDQDGAGQGQVHHYATQFPFREN